MTYGVISDLYGEGMAKKSSVGAYVTGEEESPEQDEQPPEKNRGRSIERRGSPVMRV
jgi:hypothetical protein